MHLVPGLPLGAALALLTGAQMRLWCRACWARGSVRPDRTGVGALGFYGRDAEEATRRRGKQNRPGLGVPAGGDWFVAPGGSGRPDYFRRRRKRWRPRGQAKAAREHRHRVRLGDGHDGHVVAAGEGARREVRLVADRELLAIGAVDGVEAQETRIHSQLVAKVPAGATDAPVMRKKRWPSARNWLVPSS